MTATAFKAEPVPLIGDVSGGLRVAGTRVLLESLVAAFHRGDSAEEIHEQYPSVSLGDVYAVLTYYVRHRDDVAAYLAERERQGGVIQARIEAASPADGLRAKLLARLGG